MSWGLPGQVYFDRNFNFKDGATSPKLFVVLCDSPNNKENSIVVKTTSIPNAPWAIGQDSYNETYGCYPNVRIPNFFIPSSPKGFKKPTWLVLDEVYEYEQCDLKSWKVILTLDMNTTIAVIHCAQQSPYVEINVTDKLKQTENSLK